MNRRGFAAALAAPLLMAAAALAQQKKALTLRGTVEGVDADNKKLTVKNEKLEGYMDSMTMSYPVDNPAVLKKLKKGDQIKATVYAGDYSLHNVQIVPKTGAASKAK